MTRTWLRSVVVGVAVMAAAASANAQTTQGQAQGTATQKSGSGNQMSGSKDKQYVQKMLMANMAEVQLGQMASERASNPEVKSFAQMLVTDHTKANQELM